VHGGVAERIGDLSGGAAQELSVGKQSERVGMMLL
jgi:hypothetical protein